MLKYKELTIEKFNHCTILVQDNLVIYFDPFKIDMMNMPRADIIFISHHHQDHCSPDDIEKILKNDTLIVATENCRMILDKFRQNKEYIKVGDELEYKGVKISTIPAYNLDKFRSPGQLFHSKEDGGIGYVINMNDVNLYFAGDTDNIPELAALKSIDIAFLPISGTYVMTVEEAVKAIGQFKPKIVVPIHYGLIVGSRNQAVELEELVENTKIKILD
ncbi:MBL fold metallo-hydrolase [Patescibacteria group bacterium]|nr:MBL fold metallo-hydrolase [Patescibacteria group bacterium]